MFLVMHMPSPPHSSEFHLILFPLKLKAPIILILLQSVQGKEGCVKQRTCLINVSVQSKQMGCSCEYQHDDQPAYSHLGVWEGETLSEGP